jgi:membrane-bound metal-dependent hydrolase YbcI (DUF457 family)
VGLAAGRAGAGRGRLVAAMSLLAVLSLLPDLDVIGFRFGVAYGAPFGHRGATHSLFVGVLIGIVVRPIPVAPIGRRLFTSWGERVLGTELLMFSPILLYALLPRSRRASSTA